MWPRIVMAILGVWLTIAPAVLDYPDPLRTNDHICGPIVATLAIVSAWPTTRSLRWLNVGIAAWLVISPFVLGSPWPESASAFGVGAVNLVLCFFKGSPYRPQDYGGGWLAIVDPARSPLPGSEA